MEKIRILLADCLREEANGYVINKLISAFPSTQELMNAEEEEFKLIKGIGSAKARQLAAILELIRKINAPNVKERPIIRRPEDVYGIMRFKMECLQTEHFCVVGLSTKNHVIFQETISQGTLNASLVHPREVFKHLIKRACASAVLVHNHPSGDPLPSQEDIVLTRKLIEASKLLDIQLLDHIVIGQGRYISLKERGLI